MAFAATAYSGWISLGTTNGYNYERQSWVSSDSKAGGGMIRSTSGSAPTGWMGVEPLLVRNGVLCAAGTTAYNTAAVMQFANSVSGNCGSGTYNSTNKFYRWNGAGYQANGFYPSPNVTW